MRASTVIASPQPIAVPRTLPLLIAALSMIGPFAIDTYLPSFREMEASLRATPLQVQQSLTAYLIPFALMSLWHGSISDALGRRRVILVALAALAFTSVGSRRASTCFGSSACCKDSHPAQASSSDAQWCATSTKATTRSG